MLLRATPLAMDSEDRELSSKELEQKLADPEFQGWALAIVRRTLRWRALPMSVDEEDVSQVVMKRLLVYLRRDSERKITNWRGLIITTTHNIVKDLCLKDKGGSHSSYVPLDDAPAFVLICEPEQARNIEFGLLLEDFHARLNEEERITLDCIVEGYTSAEMAARMEISAVNARQRVSRLKRRLWEHLFGSSSTGQTDRS